MAATMKGMLFPANLMCRDAYKLFQVKNSIAILNINRRFLGNVDDNASTCTNKYKSEFFNRHALVSIAAKRKLLGLDPNPPDDFVPSNTDIEESTSEWPFVERLIPMTMIPTPPDQPFPTLTGWKPPADPIPDLPYYVRRTSRHFFNVTFHADRNLTLKYTKLAYIEGDIWTLEEDLRSHLESFLRRGKRIKTQVHEAAGYISFKSDDYSKQINDWLFNTGF